MVPLCLLLSTVLTEGWATRQVDYTNAFAQAEINEEVYIECPCLFGPKSGSTRVLKLLKSLYGLTPRTFFEKLRNGLLERGYKQSTVDPCLLIKGGIMCVVYVDDIIFAVADPKVLEAKKSQMRHNAINFSYVMKEKCDLSWVSRFKRGDQMSFTFHNLD
jgi:Reverse transcriptase (RNA-dependent DNA polymerase)